MQALRVVSSGELRVEQIPEPVADASEVVVELRCAALNRRRCLFVRGGLRAGETVLVLGAGSGVSTFLVQLAQAWPFRRRPRGNG